LIFRLIDIDREAPASEDFQASWPDKAFLKQAVHRIPKRHQRFSWVFPHHGHVVSPSINFERVYYEPDNSTMHSALLLNKTIVTLGPHLYGHRAYLLLTLLTLTSSQQVSFSTHDKCLSSLSKYLVVHRQAIISHLSVSQKTSVKPRYYKSITIIHCIVTDESQDSFLFPTRINLVTSTVIVRAGSALHGSSFTMSA
jgi:hypothetical protein